MRRSILPAIACAALGGPLPAFALTDDEPTAVTTYHNDILRTGWNSHERVLTPGSVASGQPNGNVFELLQSVALDDQVDAQPLVVPNVTLSAGSYAGTTHTVVYVVTENNSIYAVDDTTGAVLLQANLGPPVPETVSNCDNNSTGIGINSTPVVSASDGTLYLMSSTYDNGTTPTYRLHALDITNLTDKRTPAVVSASGQQANGGTYEFNASVSRQRPGLLLANGNIYAGFGSFCDYHASQSRGWVMGWKARTLKPLSVKVLTNKDQQAPGSTYFLSSIWAAGYGLAANHAGDIFFSTGNSNPNGATYSPGVNYSETALEMSPDLGTVVSFFTPANHSQLDIGDSDLGSGGLMLLPPQAGLDLAVVGGKAGILYLLNADNLGNNAGGTGISLDTHKMGGCWCGPSYFTGSDGNGYVVSSGGFKANIWRVNTAPPGLVNVASTAILPGDQDPGFFTSISSRGRAGGSYIIWALGRATGLFHTITLYAFDAGTGATLYSGVAGNWPNATGDSNLVPTVANGRVYVATDKQLAIFGFGPPGTAASIRLATAAPAEPLPEGMHEIWGIVKSTSGTALTMQKRDGRIVTVDFADAARNYLVADISSGDSARAIGKFNAAGVLVADHVLRAKKSPNAWRSDR